MKNPATLVLTVAAMLTTMMPAYPTAQAQYGNRANIPFAFTANHQKLQPGCYKVIRQSESWLALVNCDTGISVGMMVHTTPSFGKIERGSLEFYNMGHSYWLTQVRFAHINMESDLAVQPKPEPTLAQNKGNTREIAMK